MYSLLLSALVVAMVCAAVAGVAALTLGVVTIHHMRALDRADREAVDNVRRYAE